MSCSICGRSSCTSSFHSLEVQRSYEEFEDMDKLDLIEEILDLRERVKQLEEDLRDFVESQPPI